MTCDIYLVRNILFHFSPYFWKKKKRKLKVRFLNYYKKGNIQFSSDSERMFDQTPTHGALENKAIINWMLSKNTSINKTKYIRKNVSKRSIADISSCGETFSMQR